MESVLRPAEDSMGRRAQPLNRSVSRVDSVQRQFILFGSRPINCLAAGRINRPLERSLKVVLTVSSEPVTVQLMPNNATVNRKEPGLPSLRL